MHLRQLQILALAPMSNLAGVSAAFIAPRHQSSDIIVRTHQAHINNNNSNRRIANTSTCPTTCLSMGILDKLGSLLNDRGTDFVKLDRKSDDLIGPGPAILLVNCPSGIVDDELRDMMSDGVTSVPYGVVRFRRIDTDNETDEKLLGQSVLKVFEDISVSSDDADDAVRMAEVMPSNISPSDVLRSYASSVPVIYFSGISNTEMIDTYNIIAQEIYNETGGAADAACAKLVKPAFDKSLRQVIEEIAGDHLDAMKMN